MWVSVKNSGDPLTGTLEETSTNKQTKQKAAAGGKLCLLWVQNHNIIMSLSQVLTSIKLIHKISKGPWLHTHYQGQQLAATFCTK